MSHTRYEHMLAMYRDLGAAQRAELDRHLAACSDCAARLAAYRAMDEKLGALRDAAPSGELRARFYAALAQRRGRSRLPAWLGYVAQAAMTVFLIVGVWAVLQSRLHTGTEPGTIPTPTATGASTPAPTALSVAFVKDGNVWLWREGAQAVPLTKDGGASSVRLSPDGTIVAFVRDGELWAVNTDGAQGKRRLVSTEDLAALAKDGASVVIEQFGWQPGSHRLTYNTRPAHVPEPGQSAWNDDLQQVDADTLAKRTLLPAGQGGDFYYSPDGSRIAIATLDSISLVSADGTNRQDVLTYTPMATTGGHGYRPVPVWAADGSYLVAAIPPVEPQGRPVEETTVWHLPADGAAATPLARIPWSVCGRGLAISPDLAYIACVQDPEGAPLDFGADPVLAITALGTDETTVYCPNIQEIYGWAPDSQHLAFLAGQDQAPQALIGRPGAQAVSAYDPSPIMSGMLFANLRWVDASHYLLLLENADRADLVLGEIGGPGRVVATQVATSAQMLNGMPLPVYDFARSK